MPAFRAPRFYYPLHFMLLWLLFVSRRFLPAAACIDAFFLLTTAQSAQPVVAKRRTGRCLFLQVCWPGLVWFGLVRFPSLLFGMAFHVVVACTKYALNAIYFHVSVSLRVL